MASSLLNAANGIYSYLDRVCIRLHANPAEVEDIRREIRLHLEDMIEEYCAEGMSRPEAAERAIAWLGEAEQLRVWLDRVHHGDPGWVRCLKSMALGGLLGAILSRWVGACLLPFGSTTADALLGLAAGCGIGLFSASRSGLMAGLAIGSLASSGVPRPLLQCRPATRRVLRVINVSA